MSAARSFFSSGQKQPMRMRRDAAPLSPAELIALRRLLRQPVVDDSLKPREVARKLGLNRLTVLAMVKRGEFPNAFKPSANVVRIPQGDVLAWQARNRVQTPALSMETQPA